MRMMTSARGLAAAAVCGLFCVGAAAASDVEGVRAKFKEMDTNADRSLQFSEIQAARANIFDRMDVNGNAILDRDEIENVRKVAQSHATQKGSRQGGFLGEGNLAERAKQMDADGDGKISRAEFVAYLPERLRAADKDGNQTLSLRELRSLKRDRETSATQ
ncbi:EF-hand domain-containing protein [Mesorhizobium sp. KR9-304]|uniref:EF-hand domain-containing protein n=1 Tax=Mesorhizobium sp. KR9-304 TaxID=3156614 RepID=UPI0032B6141F